MVRGGILFVAALLGAGALPLVPDAAQAQNERARSGTDLNRIATLVYQAADTQNAAARRADDLVRGLRQRVETSSAALARIRATVADLKRSGARAEARLKQLERELDQQEREAAEAKAAFAAELAAKDADYARERSVLLTTGQQLLETPEGRRVLDLYNSGGAEAWQQAKVILETMRKVRRAADTRAAARLYLNKRFLGQETTEATLPLFEEVVADDPSNSADWSDLADLYLDKAEAGKALSAAERAVATAPDLAQKALALKTLAAAAGRLGRLEQAQEALDEGLALVRGQLAAEPQSGELQYLAAQLLQALGEVARWRSDYRAALAYANEELALLSRDWPGHAVYRFAFAYGRANAHRQIADIRMEIDEYAEALASYERSIAQWRAVLAEGFDRPMVKENLAYAQMKSMVTLLWAGDLEKARSYGEESVSLFRSLAAADPGNRMYASNVASALSQLAQTHERLGDDQSALDKYVEALALKKDHAAGPDAAPASVSDFAVMLSSTGRVLGRLGRTEEAVQHLKRAIAEREHALRKLPGSSLVEQGLANAHLELAQIQEATDLQAALASYRTALERQRALVERFPDQHGLGHQLAIAMIRYANALDTAGDRPQALKVLREAEASQRKTAADNPAVFNYRMLLGLLLVFEGQMEAKAGNSAAATAKLTESLVLWEKLAAEQPSRGEPRRNIAAVLAELAGLEAPGHDWNKVVAYYERLGAAKLTGDERKLLAEARAKAAGKGAPETGPAERGGQ